MPPVGRRLLLLALADGEGEAAVRAGAAFDFDVATALDAADLVAGAADPTTVAVVLGQRFLTDSGSHLPTRLRSGGVLADVPLLALGEWDEAGLVRLLESGVDAVLPAGASEGLIAGQLRRLVARAGRAGELRTALERRRREADAYRRRLRHVEESTLMIVHDLKSPIAAVMGLLEHALEDEGLSEATHESLTLARGEAAYLSELASDVIELRRLEGGQPVFRPEAVADLRGLVEQALLDAGARFQDRALTVAIDVDGRPVADPRLLRRILANLVSNAFKFTRPGGRVSVTATRCGGGLSFTVGDDGVGMTEDQRRGVEAADVLRGDSGIGLAFCRAAVALHGGELSLAAGTGGTSVTFTLPAAGLGEETAVGE